MGNGRSGGGLGGERGDDCVCDLRLKSHGSGSFCHLKSNNGGLELEQAAVAAAAENEAYGEAKSYRTCRIPADNAKMRRNSWRR